jgi:protein SCO1/2
MADVLAVDWLVASRAMIGTPRRERARSTTPVIALLGVLAWLSAALLSGTAAVIPLSGAIAASPAPPGGPFTLQDGDGNAVSDRDFRGRYMLVYFGYTLCPDACPTTLGDVTDALDRLGAKAAQIQPIFITVDPTRDTPSVIKQFTAAFGPRLIGLTGLPEQIAELAKAYRVYHVKNRTGPGQDDYSIDHSSILYLMGPDGAFIAAIRGDQSGAEIADDLSELMP